MIDPTLIKLLLVLFIAIPFLIFSVKQFRKKGFFRIKPTEEELADSRALAEKLRQEGKSENEIMKAVIQESIRGKTSKEKAND